MGLLVFGAWSMSEFVAALLADVGRTAYGFPPGGVGDVGDGLPGADAVAGLSALLELRFTSVPALII
jgi:hypothetical protein